MSRLVEVRPVEGAVGGDAVQVEQPGIELFREGRAERVSQERRRTDHEHLRRAAAGAGLGRTRGTDEPPDAARDAVVGDEVDVVRAEGDHHEVDRRVREQAR